MRTTSDGGSLDQAVIRQALVTYLMSQHPRGERSLIAELPLRAGASRADLVLLGDELHAFEIKSDRDSLDRLQTQIHAYSRVFDEVTIVTGSVHLARASKSVPEWWGVMLGFRSYSGNVNFACVKHSRKNPSPDNYALAQILRIDEVDFLMSQHFSHVAPRSSSRKAACQALADLTDHDLLRSIVATSLRRRRSAQVAAPPLSDGG